MTSKPALHPRPKFETTHARHDRWHVLAGGLFRSLAKGQQAKTKLRAWYGTDKSTSADQGKTGIEFVGPDPLGALELRVLQVLIALATKNIKPLPVQPKTIEGTELRQAVDANRDLARKDDEHLTVRTSYRNIAVEVGLDPDSESGFKRVQKSIERMANVSIWEQTEGKTSQMPIRSKIGSLLEKVTTQDPKSQVLVAINARLSKTILASGQYTRIELDEARALSDPGVVIHQRLCGAIDQGDTWTISMTKLISYAWPEEAKLRHSGRRRKQKVLEVLDELVVLGWKWVEDTPDNFKITRPS